MKKVVICNIPMRKNEMRYIYKSDDLSLITSDRAVFYPINAFLEKHLEKSDEVKVILLVKRDLQNASNQNVSDFIDEIMSVNSVGANIVYKIIETDYSEEQFVHEKLMSDIIDEIDDNAHIQCDITYGPKDLPIVLFSALNFAEKFLHCDIDNILYGKATFLDGKPTDTKLCDMVPLYYLNSVTNTIRCDDSQKARKMLKDLLSL